LTRISPPEGVNLTALERRLSITWRIDFSSAQTIGKFSSNASMMRMFLLRALSCIKADAVLGDIGKRQRSSR
jgi:hypothetical protein